jgi:phenylacetate-CoA ligase
MIIKNFNSLIFYLKNKIFRKMAYAHYKEALKHEKTLTKQEINDINFQKRINLVKYAYHNIPFYKKFYDDHKIDIEKVSNRGYWAELPILEKEHLRNFTTSFTTKHTNPKRYIKTTTGGSTGEPLTVFRDKQFPEEIVKWRMLRRWSLGPATDIVMFWRVPSSRSSKLSKKKNELLWWPTKRIGLDVSSLDDKKFLYLTKQINKYKPALFWGYVGAIDQYCQFLLKNNIQLDYKPKCVWTTAAPLSKLQEKTISKALTMNILNQYACSEIHWIAANIPQTKQLIVEHDYRHIDIVDNHDKNIYEYDEFGDLLITDLHNYAFPLIKYRVGDRGSFAKPDTNDYPNFPRINPVKGRKTDYIITKTGNIISGEYLTTIFDNYTSEVSQFQIHQTGEDKVIVRLSLNKNANKYFIEVVKRNLKEVSNNELHIEFIIVERIESDRGKIRFVKNDLIH